MGLQFHEVRAKKTIGEYTFSIRPFPAFTSASVSARTISALAPCANLIGALAGGKSDNMFDIDVSSLAPALAGVSPAKIEETLKDLLIEHNNISVSKENGKAEPLTKDLVDNIFCQNVEGMLSLAIEVIKVNFPNISEKLKNQFGNQNLTEILATA